MKRAAMAMAATILCIAFVLGAGDALMRYARPMNSFTYDLSLIWSGEAMPEGWTYDQKGWTVFTMRGGRKHVLNATETGGFWGDVQPDETFYFSRTLTENVDAPQLQIDAYDRSMAVFLDGELLYSDGPQQSIGELVLGELGWVRSTPVIVDLPDDYIGKELTIAQNAGSVELDIEGAQFVVFPCAVTLGCGYAYESGLISGSFGAAIPATLLMAAGMFLMFAFVVGAWRGRWNGMAFSAALYIFLWMAGLLADTFFFSAYHPRLQDNTAYICRCMALSTLLMFLASRAVRLRTLSWTLAILNAACSVLTLYMDLTNDVYTDDLSIFLHDVPFQLTGFVGLIAAMACAWLMWRKGGLFYRIFAPLTAIGLVGLLLFAAIFNGEFILVQLKLAFLNMSFAFFLWPLMAVTATAAAISAISELIAQEFERRMEARQIAERGAMALASYQGMCSQHEQVMMLRHDLSRHLHVLRQLTCEEAAQSYLDELIGQNERIPVIVQSGNSMIDIILNCRLSNAAALGIEVEISSAQAPQALPMSKADLCSLMLNLMDNALAAASAPTLKRRRIRLDLRVKGGFFVFVCENTCAQCAESPKQGHGLGLKIVKSIAERYDCLMELEHAAGSYKVIIAVPIE